MAELAVSAALVLVEIVSPLIGELNLQEDVKDEIRRMESWLKSMKAFIEDHYYGGEGSRRVDQDRMDKARDIAYDIEDVLDEFVLHSPPYTFHNHGITRKVHKYAHHVYHGFPLHRISEKIARIRKSIDDMRTQQEVLSNGSTTIRPLPSSCTTRVSPLLLHDQMVGYEKQKKEFILQLVGQEKSLVTLAAAGAGGSGKTTFVKNVLEGIRGQFDCNAWVRVSQHFNVEDLFINILKQFYASRNEPYPSDQGLHAVSKLQDYLAGKKYVLVLDDIWSTDDWDAIKVGLPDAFRGSRIIVTTRNSNVASICSTSSNHKYDLIGLEWLEGMTLFCRKAFPDTNGECPSDLKDCSTKIVARCEGLPLAIVTVGGALSKKQRLPNEWERFHDSLGWEIGNGSNLFGISNALLPSYIDLSSNLKSCFLYFSIFPEDYSVERGRLIRLWVAERFAMEAHGQTAEQVAEDYLNELIQRNLVYVSSWDFDGRPRSCRVLNPVFKFIIQKCKDENFASIFPGENTSQSQKIRRLCVHTDCSHLPRNSVFHGVRSVFLLRLLKMPPPEFEANLCKLKLARVLDFQGAPLTEFPKDISCLTLLRHLNLRGTNIKMIPSSIKKLSYLETLDLKQTHVTKLPKEISYLHNLRHLFAYKNNVDNFVDFESVQGVKISEGIGNLTNLQDLSLIKVGQKAKILQEVIRLTKLRKLGLMGLKSVHGTELSVSLQQMPSLRTLDLCSITKEEVLELGVMKNPPHALQRLYLKGRLNELPVWISSLNNLLRIGLKWSKMHKSPLQALEHLPHLMELQLVDCYIGRELTFEASTFKELKILLIEELSDLHTIAIGAGAMPDVKQISLRRCPKLKILPLGIENLTKVEELTLYDMAQEFVALLRKNNEDSVLVRHITVIHSFTLKDQDWSFENLSASFSR